MLTLGLVGEMHKFVVWVIRAPSALSVVKTPSCLILLAFSRRGSNSTPFYDAFYKNTSLDSYGHLLGSLSISPFPVRSQNIARDRDPYPPSTTSRPQPLRQTAEASSAR